MELKDIHDIESKEKRIRKLFAQHDELKAQYNMMQISEQFTDYHIHVFPVTMEIKE